MSLHEVIKMRASTNDPETLAVHAWDGDVTYVQLDRLTSALVGELQSHGAGPGSFVPVLFEKSALAVIAMLAINKAGAAFVPLDPEQPSARHRYIISECGAKLMLSSEKYAEALPGSVARLIVLSQTALSQMGGQNKAEAVDLSAPAYCLFTSGSTGKPKGCLVSHAAFAGVAVHGKALQLTPGRRVLQFASYSFGVSIIEVFVTLANHATVCIPSDEDRMSRLPEVMREMGVDWALMTPTTLTYLQPGDVPSLQWLVVAGELLPRSQLDKWVNEVRLFQAYGLTEWAGIFCVSSRIKSAEDRHVIGKPASARIWLSDPKNHDRLAPVGTTAELVIEGPCLAEGYLNQPDKTREAFVDRCRWMEAYDGGPRRVYRTGDLVKYNVDGSLSYVGRKDTQIKLYGRRIEAGEVEFQILQAWPASTQPKVIVEVVKQPGINERKTLMAFVGCNISNDKSENEPMFQRADEEFQSASQKVKTILHANLPSYMVPEFIIPLHRLPMTVSGKTDRRQLCQEMGKLTSMELLALLNPDTQNNSRPLTKHERLIHRMVTTLLELNPDQVGMEQSFFQIGGDSVAAIKLVRAARNEGIKLSVSDIVKHPLLSEIAHGSATSKEAPRDSPAEFALLENECEREAILKAASEQCSVSQDVIEDIYGCTPLQEGLTALTMKNEGAYVARFIFTMSPDVDTSNFKFAWQKTINSNPILRTRIIHTTRGTFQVVLRPAQSLWDEAIDLDSYLAAVDSKPMSLGTPLLYHGLVTEKNGARYFVLTAHHAVCDRWSVNALMQQVERTYKGHKLQRQAFAPFIDYIKKQQVDSKTYWNAHLSGLDADVFPRLPHPNYVPVQNEVVHYPIQLPANIPMMGYTMADFIRLAWATVIWQYTGRSDVVFGETVTGRNAPVPLIEDMTGPTIATVPIRMQIHGEKRVLDALQATRYQLGEMIAYEQAGLQNIQKCGPDASMACSFQSQLIVQPALNRQSVIFPSVAESSAVSGGFASYAMVLMCYMSDRNDRVNLELNLDSNVISVQQARWILQHFEHILCTLLTHPYQTTSSISSVGRGQFNQLCRWNAEVPLGEESCVHDRIAIRVSQQPDAQAICAWDGSFTYQQLNDISSALAVRLRSLGVGPEISVPVHMEKSRWTVVAIYAIMKAGGAFALLDPYHPVGRLRVICEQLNCPIILSSAATQHISNDLAETVVIVEKEAANALHRETPVPFSLSPTNTLYIVFTSGSTGNPKGIIIDHQAFLSSAVSRRKIIGLQPRSRTLQFASYAFDVSVFDHLDTLLAGGCICIPSDTDRQNNIAAVVRQINANTAILTPSVARELKPEEVPCLRTLGLTGEPMSREDVETWAPSVSLLNTYGPAECSVISTIQSGFEPGFEPSCIGFGTGAVCWVVHPSDHTQLLPLGAVGELLLEGPIVGRGYLNDPEKTSQAFVQAPQWLRALRCGNESRLYKTGDLVRYSADGSLNYIGRKDTQVKLRGQRIELGEIESHLRRQFDVTDVVADLVTRPRIGGKMLVGFILYQVEEENTSMGDEDRIFMSPTPSFKTRSASVKSALGEVLPSVMVPSLFIPVRYIPRSLSGKTDRRKLQNLLQSMEPNHLAKYSVNETETLPRREPATRTEKALCSLWETVLGIPSETIGLDDNFLKLGGDSILAMRMVSHAGASGMQLTVADIFRYPKLVDMAGCVRQETPDRAPSSRPRFALLSLDEVDCATALAEIAGICHVDANQIEDSFPCTPLQEGLFALTSHNSEAYVGQWVFQLSTATDIKRFRSAWDTVFQAHPILRTRIVSTEATGMVQVILRESLTWHEFVDDDSAMPARIGATMNSGQPLVRLGIRAAKADQTAQFVLSMHHAVYDAWTLSLILADADGAYNARSLKPRSFRPFIEYTLQNRNVESFWADYLGGQQASIFPPLPSPTTRPLATSRLEKEVSFCLPKNNEFTPSTMVRLSWALTQAHYQNSTDIIFGVTVSGRNAPVADIELISGPTIATVPWRACLDLQYTTVFQSLREMQDHATEMIPFEQIGLQNIRKLGPDCAAAVSFQTLLVVEQDSAAPNMGGLGDSHNTSAQGFIANYALTLICLVSPEAIKLQAYFDPQVIPHAQMGRVLDQFAHQIRQIGDQVNIDTILSEVMMISLDDKNRIAKWNGRVPPIYPACIHDVIRGHCSKNPTGLAIDAPDGIITYNELDRLSTLLAIALVHCGVRPQAFVPICSHKSKWTTVTMLGVIKAGAAFVLLDTSYPVSRLQALCQNTDSDLIISSAEKQQLSSKLGKNVFVVNTDDQTWATEFSVCHLPLIEPSFPLYMVFTSGSTGLPKGVIIEHQSYYCSAQAHSKAFGIDQNSRVLQFAAYAFDISILENLTTLMAGGCVCVLPESKRTDQCLPSIRSMKCTHAVLTPSFARALGQNDNDYPFVSTLILAGEVVKQVDLDTWAERLTLMNGYGPAECSAISTVQSCISRRSDPSNIGYPTGGLCWVVNPEDHNRLVPIGAVGELLIEGPIVGQGYHDNQKATASAFIQAPPWRHLFDSSYPDGNSARFYKTGDLVRLNDDGSLSCLGRKDSQVKIRGQRVELGEVEHHVLHCFKRARDVIADIITPQQSQPVLTAFVLTDKIDSQATSRSPCAEHGFIGSPSQSFLEKAGDAQLRLHNALPTSFVPGLFLPLNTSPRGPTGKSDRKGLRNAVEKMSVERLATYRPLSRSRYLPSNETQQTIRSIWARILNLPAHNIGIHDNFFHLGGDSITAMQVSGQCRAQGLILSTADIFHSKTIAALEKKAASAENSSYRVKEDKEEIGRPFNLSPIQTYFLQRNTEAADHFNQTFLLKLRRPITAQAIEKALTRVIHKHSLLRARYMRHDDGTWSQVITDDTRGAYRFNCLSSSSHLMPPLLQQAQAEINIQKGPILVCQLLDLVDGTQRLMLVIHHLVIDLVSWRILLSDLEELLLLGETHMATPMSFQVWSRMQAEYAQTLKPEVALPDKCFNNSQGEYVEKFWRLHDRENLSGDSIVREFSVNEESTRHLLGAANRAFDTQPQEILIAAIVHSFSVTFQNRAPPMLFAEGHGREPWDPSVDLSRTIGWFTTFYPVAMAQGTGGKSLPNMVRWIKDARRRVPANGWAYFTSRFLTEDGKTAFRGHSPLEILFNYAGLYQQFDRSDALFDIDMTHDLQKISVSGRSVRMAFFDVYASVVRNKLHFRFSYNRRMRYQAEIDEWIRSCEACVASAPAVLLDLAWRPTLTDFSAWPFTYSELDLFLQSCLSDMSIAPCSIEDAYPCSPTQRGILLSQAKNPGHYLVSFGWEVSNKDLSIDTARIEMAWRQVVGRHPALRTVFMDGPSDESSTIQVVLRSDAVGHLLNTHSAEGGQLVIESSRLCHRFCVTVSEDKKVTVRLEISHAVIDGFSLGILKGELCRAYNDRLPAGSAPGMNAYISFLHRQPQDKASGFWKEYLQGFEPSLMPQFGSGRDDRTIETRINLNCGAKLQQFSRSSSVTVSNILQVAWALTLRAYAGSDDICFGYLTSGRDIPVDDIEQTVGAFVNMLPCRLHFHPDKPLHHFLDQAHASYIRVLEHQFYSLADMGQLIGATGKPLFNTAMSIQRLSATPKPNDGTSLDFCLIESREPTEYDVILHIDISEAIPVVLMVYKAAAMSPSRAQSVAETFDLALSTILEQPHCSLRDAHLVSAADLEELQCWNREVPPPGQRCVDEVILDHCRERPDSQAICAWDGNITYRELADLSARLSGYLIQHGANRGDVIALCFEKSKWTPVTILAVIRAGATFLLLDPSYPPERLRGMCDDVSTRMVLCMENTTSIASQLSQQMIQVVGPDSESWQSAVRVEADRSSAQDALYVVFTSGSTGRPKGVVIEHSSYVAGAQAHIPAFTICQTSGVLQFASYAFDASIIETLSPLMAGGCVCVISEIERRNDLVKAMHRVLANLAFLTPSTARLLPREEMSNLDTLILCGERMTAADISYWSGQLRLINGYGPAECSISASVQSSIGPESDPRNIGYPTGAVAWIVHPKDHDKLQPIGAVGELLIEGPIVGRHYLNNPVKTAESFISAPKWLLELRSQDLAPIRLYKTGDLARFTDNGSLIYEGRKDTQIKLRGQRIEPGEVEDHVRRSFDAAADVIVELASPKGSTGVSCLIAFISTGEDIDYSVEKTLFLPPSPRFIAMAATAEQKLQASLPSYMVPTFLLQVAHIPQTVSGKADRRGLRRLVEAVSWSILQTYNSPVKRKEPPCTKPEIELQTIWSQTLGVDINLIGRQDSFFRLGGDSISATKVVSISRKRGFDITVAEIFERPTLHEMSVALQQNSTANIVDDGPFSLIPTSENRSDLVRVAVDQCQVTEEDIEDIYPATPLQEGLLTLTVKQPDAYVGRWVFTLPRDTDLIALHNAIIAVVAQHPILRTRLVQTDAGCFQVVMKEHVAFLQLQEAGEYTSSLDAEGATMVFGSHLVRMVLWESKGVKHLTLIMHHALYDAWSLPMLLEHVEAAFYGNLPDYPPKYTAFVRYISEKRIFDQQYWREQYAGLEFAPFPSPRSPKSQPNASAVETKSWKYSMDHVALADFTQSAVLRLSWAVVQGQYQGRDDVVYGVTVSGRSAPVPGIERMTGPTIATVPLRIAIDQNVTVAEMLKRVQDQSTAMIPHEQTGLPTIRKASCEAQQACGFQTLLVIQGSGVGPVSFGLFRDVNFSAGAYFLSTYPLTLLCSSQGERLEIEAHFDEEILSRVEVNRLIASFAHMVDTIGASSHRTLSDFMDISPLDWQTIIDWNQTVPAPTESSVHDIIAKKSQKNPEHAAVAAWDGHLSYGELDRLSTILANQLLLEKQVKVGDFIPLLFHKSVWTIVAMLAAMKAGAAFVLLDPSYPVARLRRICVDVGCKLIITGSRDRQMASALGQGFSISILEVDQKAFARSDMSSCLLTPVSPSSILYALFTSGSTGKPKGVLGTHQSYASQATALIEKIELDSKSHVLQFASYAFDMSIIESLTTLMAGSCLCIISEEQRLSDFATAVEEFDISHMFLTPTFARTQKGSRFKTVKTLVLIGEQVTSDDIVQWSGSVRLMNGYGPAECGTVTVQTDLDSASKAGDIGCGAGAVCWVVKPDNPNQLVPIGTVGELLIESPSVGAGYLNAPDETRKAFIPPPGWLQDFRHDAHSRVYRTGDLVRQGLHGELYFVGRKDAQIKIHGQRIEREEVERHILRVFDGALEVVVDVVSLHESPALVVFVHCSYCDGGEFNGPGYLLPPTTDFQQSAKDAEQRLRALVPSPMVPKLFLPVSAIPRTLTNKTDRRALISLVDELTQREIEMYRPSTKGMRSAVTDAEDALMSICAQILKLPLDAIHPDVGFLDMGGDSISAMKVAAMARARGLDLKVTDLLDTPVLSNLARQCESSSPTIPVAEPYRPFALARRDPHTIRQEIEEKQLISPGFVVQDILPVTSTQSFFLNQWSLVNFMFHLHGELDVSRLSAACLAIINKYSILRTVFIELHGEFTQVVTGKVLTAPFVHVKLDSNTLLQEHSSAALRQDTHRTPFGRRPLHFTLFSGPPDRYVLYLSLSHALYDGVSLPLLFHDLASAYNHGCAGLGLEIPFSHYLYHRFHQDDSSAIGFWREYLNGASLTALEQPSPEETKADTIVVSTTVQPLPIPPVGITLATLVKTAWAVVLAQESGQRDLVFGQTVNGRSIPMQGVDRILGPCLNFVPFRIRLDASHSVLDFVSEVQKQHIRTVSYDYVSLETITRHCTQWRNAVNSNDDSDVRFPFIVQHQNVDLCLDLPLDGIETHFEASSDWQPHHQTFIISAPYSDRLKLSIYSSTSEITEQRALSLIERVGRVLKVFVQDPSCPVSSWVV